MTEKYLPSDRSDEGLKKGVAKYGQPVPERELGKHVERTPSEKKNSGDECICGEHARQHKEECPLAPKKNAGNKCPECGVLVRLSHELPSGKRAHECPQCHQEWDAKDLVNDGEAAAPASGDVDSGKLGYEQPMATTTKKRGEAENHEGNPGPIMHDVENGDPKAEAEEIARHAEGIKHEVEEIMENAEGKPGTHPFVFVDTSGEEVRVDATSEEAAWDKLAADYATPVSDIKGMGIHLKNDFEPGCGCGHQYGEHHPGDDSSFPCGLCKCATYHKAAGKNLDFKENASVDDMAKDKGHGDFSNKEKPNSPDSTFTDPERAEQDDVMEGPYTRQNDLTYKGYTIKSPVDENFGGYRCEVWKDGRAILITSTTHKSPSDALKEGRDRIDSGEGIKWSYSNDTAPDRSILRDGVSTGENRYGRREKA